MKKYSVEMYYNWRTTIDVEADSPKEAWEKARETPDKEIFDGFSVGDLDFDFFIVNDDKGNEVCVEEE